MYVWWYSAVSHTSISVLQNWYFFWTLWGQNSFSTLFIFAWTDSLYTILKLTPYRKIFSTIYNIPDLVSIPSLTKEMSRNHLERLTKRVKCNVIHNFTEEKVKGKSTMCVLITQGNAYIQQWDQCGMLFIALLTAKEIIYIPLQVVLKRIIGRSVANLFLGKIILPFTWKP